MTLGRAKRWLSHIFSRRDRRAAQGFEALCADPAFAEEFKQRLADGILRQREEDLLAAIFGDGVRIGSKDSRRGTW